MLSFNKSCNSLIGYSFTRTYVISEPVPVTLEIQGPSGRYRRNAGGATPPDNIRLIVSSPYDVTTLYVRRVRRNAKQPRIYSATKHGFIKEETVSTAVRRPLSRIDIMAVQLSLSVKEGHELSILFQESALYVNDTDKTTISLTWNNMTSQKFVRNSVLHMSKLV